MWEVLVNKLQYFISVYELNSITAAAKKHYVTQVAMSQQIKALEELGVTLFLREKNHICPTGAAHFLYEESHSLIFAYDKLLDDIVYYRDDIKKTIKIGINYYSLYEYLQPLTQKYICLYKDVSVVYDFASSNNLINKLDKGALDIIIVWDDYAKNLGFNTLPAMTANSTVLVPVGNSLYNEKVFRYDMLKNQRIVVLVEELPYFRRTGKLEELLNAIDKNTPVNKANITITDNIDKALLLASEEHQIIFTYEDKLYKLHQSNLKVFTIPHSFMECNYVFAWRKDNKNSILKAFTHMLESCR